MEKGSLNIKLTRTEKESQENSVFVNIFWMSSMGALFINYFYTNFLQDISASLIGGIIKTGDKIGVDTHFVRYF